MTEDEATTIRNYLNIEPTVELTPDMIKYVVYAHGGHFAQGFVEFFFGGKGDNIEIK